MSLKDVLRTYKTNGVLIPALDRHLLSLNKEKIGDGWIHPSGAMACLCETYANLMGVKMRDGTDPRLRRIFDNGTMVHRRLQRYLLDAGMTKSSPDNDYGEHAFKNEEFKVHGTADGITVVGPRVLEIKSMNSNLFKTLQGPKPEHIWQAHLYMWGLKLEEVVYLYESKDTQDLKEFVTKFDKEIFDTIFERILYVNECYNRREKPQRWTCGRCEFCKRTNDSFKEAGDVAETANYGGPSRD